MFALLQGLNCVEGKQACFLLDQHNRKEVVNTMQTDIISRSPKIAHINKNIVFLIHNNYIWEN